MKKNKIIAFALVVLMCTTVFAPSFAGAFEISWDYDIFYEGERIYGIPAKVKPKEFEYSMKEATSVTLSSASSEYIGTGSTVTIAGESYTSVVLGDVDGNGEIDSTDLLRIKKHCLDDWDLDGAFLEAADVDGDSPVDTTDYLRVKAHTLDLFNLFAGSYLTNPARFGLEGLPEVVEDAGFVDPLKVGYDKASNPVGSNITDPTIAYHDGKYYWYFPSPFGAFISSFDSLDEITTDGAIPVNFPESHYSEELWAPELHFIDGYWYLYYTAGVGANHRMHVLKSKRDTIDRKDYLNENGEFNGEEVFEYMGELALPDNKWAIDGSMFKYKGGMYFTWSGWEGDTNGQQNIYIAEMSDPLTVSSKRVEIAVPSYSWEIQKGTMLDNPTVNEAPYAFSQGDYLSITYSASGSWCDDYCIGQLIYLGGNLLDPASWYKHTEPILKTDPERFYAPGHSCIVPGEDGVLWMMFHANREANKGWDGRDTFLEPIRINENGVIEVINSDVKFSSMQEVVQNAGFKDPYVTGFTPIGNPAVQNSPDPHLTYHNGKYYWIGCFLGFIVREFDNLSDAYDLYNNPNVKTTWLSVDNLNGGEVWAPEIHFINGRWYIYFTYLEDKEENRIYTSDGQYGETNKYNLKNENRRMYVAESKTSDIYGGFNAPKLLWTDDKWAIDGSVFEYDGELYFTWSGWPGNENVTQWIYIARMSDPTSISSKRICISIPWYSWEQDKGTMPENPTVNEGPIAITSGDYLTIVYSASGSWCDGYCLGQLLFLGGDVLNPSRWQKVEYPILGSMVGDNYRFFGPGHNCFITDENGVIWVVFHAKTESGTTGWDGRHTFMYPIKIHDNGRIEVVVY